VDTLKDGCSNCGNVCCVIECRTRVKTSAGISREFGIGVRVHQRSTLSQLLFIILMVMAKVSTI